ncbi:putative Iron-sulfur flavoprotein [Blattamonas nauphoetae]|uniref:Iron-sulfur flavoprotein n=1 Tax=Blattamonas nauphoetae TaxID=2049346 RepID=A0ABQ9YHV7_9EUKA|nr:putative Iron-sulfur flavoprotein [Blattamonas nauphoetae]
MKVVLFNGSPHPKGSTSVYLAQVEAQLKARGIETELVQMGAARFVNGCRGCSACAGKNACPLAKEGDPINEWYAKLVAADGVILGSPVYYANVSTEMKSFIDRAGYISMTNGNPLKGKVGAAITVCAESGQTEAFDAINHWFAYSGIVAVSNQCWNDGKAATAEDAEKDEFGKEQLKNLGDNMADLLEKLRK